MTQDEIIRSPLGREQLVALAREAGAEFYAETLCVNGKDAHDFIERFAALVAAHEREACAKACDKVGAKHTERFGDLFKGETYADECAAAIRARGEK